MNCRQVKKYISLLLDGTLPAARAGEVRQHIQQCAECRVYYDQLLVIKNSLLVTDTGIPQPFSTGWRQKVRSVRPSKNNLLTRVLVPVAAAAVCGIFVISGLTGGFGARSAQQEASMFSAAAVEYAADEAAPAAPESAEAPAMDAGSGAVLEEVAPAADAEPSRSETEAADSAAEGTVSELVIDKTGELDRQSIIDAAKLAGAGYTLEEGSVVLTGSQAALAEVLAKLKIDEPVTQDIVIILYE